MPHGRKVLGLPVVAVVVVVVQTIFYLMGCVQDAWRGCASFVVVVGIRGRRATNPTVFYHCLSSGVRAGTTELRLAKDGKILLGLRQSFL